MALSSRIRINYCNCWKWKKICWKYRWIAMHNYSNPDTTPQHIAIIMDGNNRWARDRNLMGFEGHQAGADRLRDVLEGCREQGVKVLTVFAFSSENWSRPESEVNALMDLLATALETQTKKLNEHGVKLQLLGDLSRFSDRIQRLAERAQKETSENNTLVFNVAINYGGRWDIAQACKVLAKRVAAGELDADEISEELINQEVSTAGIPDPDLFIRTSGEYRISNFLLWQSAYSEFYFTDILWPDFDENSFTDALLKYTHRDRRFGNAVDAAPNGQSDVHELK